MPTDRPRLVGPALLALCACASPAPVKSAGTAAPSDAAAPPAPKLRALSVAVAKVPAKVAVDGDVAEWSFGDASALVAVRADGAFVAARLEGEIAEGLWVGIAADPVGVPIIGDFVAVGGTEPDLVMAVVPPGCPKPVDGQVPEDAPLSPQCLASQEAQAQMEARLTAGFRRWFRVGPAEVGSLEGGKVQPVSRATFALRETNGRRTVEAHLPPSALPRLAEAPWSTAYIAVRPPGVLPAQLPELVAEPLQVKLPEEVRFEGAALLHEAIKLSGFLAYAPGEPGSVETLRYPSFADRTSVVPRKERLYERIGSIGDAEVGKLTIASPPDDREQGTSDRAALAILTQSKLKVLSFSGEPQGAVQRDGALHVLSFVRVAKWIHDGSPNSTFLPSTRAYWDVTVVRSDGTTDVAAMTGQPPSGWKQVEPAVEPDGLVMRGVPEVWRPEDEKDYGGWRGGSVELRWVWDAAKRTYVMKVKPLKGKGLEPKR